VQIYPLTFSPVVAMEFARLIVSSQWVTAVPEHKFWKFIEIMLHFQSHSYKMLTYSSLFISTCLVCFALPRHTTLECDLPCPKEKMELLRHSLCDFHEISTVTFQKPLVISSIELGWYADFPLRMRSLHCHCFSKWTLSGLRRTEGIQNTIFFALQPQ
jgi:hypothetical protein